MMDPLKGFLVYSLDYCLKSVHASSGSIFLFQDDKKRELVLETAKAPFDVELRDVRVQLGDRIVGRVALERRPLMVEDIDKDTSFSASPKYTHYRTKSFLSVPLADYEEIIGVVNITDKLRGDSFNQSDLDIVLEISRHLGIAVNMVKSYFEEQKKRNQKLIEQVRALEEYVDESQKFSSLGKLVGSIVHEINNPLDGVSRYVNLAFDTMPADTECKRYLGEAKKGLGHIAKTVRSLLDFSWSLSPQGASIDVNREIEESLFMLDHFINSRAITVKKYFSPGLPGLPDHKLKIAFNNIIKNACEAMGNGGSLSIHTALCDNALEIVFKDTGPGISEEARAMIFRPFFTTKPAGKGSGLGLAITSDIIKRYNGSISIESKQQEGAAFIITLPFLKSNG